MKNILVIGANSALAKPCIKFWAKKKYNLYLVARNSIKLHDLKKKIKDEYNADVKISVRDLSDRNSCQKIKDEYFSENDMLDILFICYGELDENKKLLPNANQLIDYLFVNAISKIILINSFVNNFKDQKLGNIAVVTSVAGDIGKSSNYIYGSANAMLSNYLTR